MIADVLNEYSWDVWLNVIVILVHSNGRLAGLNRECEVISSPQAGRWLSPKLVVRGCVVPSSSEKIGLRRPGIEAGPITHGQTLTCGIGIPQVVGSTAVIPRGCVSDSRVVALVD